MSKIPVTCDCSLKRQNNGICNCTLDYIDLFLSDSSEVENETQIDYNFNYEDEDEEREEET